VSSFVLVTGATGKQGGAAARALLAAGTSVHALVRDPGSERAEAIAAQGATLVRGDLGDPESLKGALDGALGVFSIQSPDIADLMGDAEVCNGLNLVEAARAADVEQIVHTSVSGAGNTEPIDERRWGAHMAHYWRNKAEVELAIRESGVPRWTILRPATFMENFVRPSPYFAGMVSDRLAVAVDPDVLLAFVAVDDIGAAAAAAFADPARFDGVELELAGDMLTYREVARLLSEAFGTTVTHPEGPAQAREEGMMAEFALAQEYAGNHPAPARPALVRALGLPTTTFATWARQTF
jgi:uncharacterized protein YbjT (DUF2867 family)